MSENLLKQTMKEWLIRIDSVENRPKEITALNFGLFEPYGIELTGANRYDLEDDDWACVEDFIPKERICPEIIVDSEMKWQAVLAMFYSVLKELLMELSELTLLKVSHVTIGFSDGDLLVVK
ncbi:hypothetical protein [Enterococcus larvae]|uniref:hypothetical protein n=1 Tax=Enterococcus larvae TaxID=2794352 RepID=UPI003F2B4E48